MLWFILLFGVVTIASGASLASSLGSRREVATGRPSFESLADLTGIWDRERLESLVGPPHDDERYRADIESIAKIRRTWWKRWFDGELADAGCIGLAIIAACLIRSYPLLAWFVLAIPAVYLAISYLGGFVIVTRSRP